MISLNDMYWLLIKVSGSGWCLAIWVMDCDFFACDVFFDVILHFNYIVLITCSLCLWQNYMWVCLYSVTILYWKSLTNNCGCGLFFWPSKIENWFQLYNIVFKGYRGILLYFVSEESKMDKYDFIVEKCKCTCNIS